MLRKRQKKDLREMSYESVVEPVRKELPIKKLSSDTALMIDTSHFTQITRLL